MQDREENENPAYKPQKKHLLTKYDIKSFLMIEPINKPLRSVSR